MSKRVVYVSGGKVYSSKHVDTLEIMFTRQLSLSYCEQCKLDSCDRCVCSAIILSLQNKKGESRRVESSRVVSIGKTLVDFRVAPILPDNYDIFHYRYTYCVYELEELAKKINASCPNNSPKKQLCPKRNNILTNTLYS